MTGSPQTFTATSTGVHPDIETLLDVELLSAFMRSTWTWDDRALRRDLSLLLVDATAARELTISADDEIQALAAQVLTSRTRSRAAGFVSTVLGPKLLAHTGNRFRNELLHLVQSAPESIRSERSSIHDLVGAIEVPLTYRPRDESEWISGSRSEGAAGIAAAMESSGWNPADSPFFASIGLAAQTLAAAGAQDSIFEQIAEGTLTATLAVAEKTGSWDPALVRTRSTVENGLWTVSGMKQFVPDAAAVDVVYVIARSTAGPSLFEVVAAHPGVTWSEQLSVDRSRGLFEVSLDEVPATLIGREGGGGRLMNRVLDLATTALASEQVGIIERCRSLVSDTGDGADARTPALVELAVLAASARALRDHAVALIPSATDAAAVAAATAHIGCSAAAHTATTIASDLVSEAGAAQVATADALSARALTDELLFGGPAVAHERLLERLGI